MQSANKKQDPQNPPPRLLRTPGTGLPTFPGNGVWNLTGTRLEVDCAPAPADDETAILTDLILRLGKQGGNQAPTAKGLRAVYLVTPCFYWCAHYDSKVNQDGGLGPGVGVILALNLLTLWSIS
jgi:hypothetical protein